MTHTQPLSISDIKKLLPTVKIKGQDPKAMVWLTQKDAIAYALAVQDALIKQEQLIDVSVDSVDVVDYSESEILSIERILAEPKAQDQILDESWERHQAKRILRELKSHRSPIGWFYRNEDENGYEWVHLADNQRDADRYDLHVIPLYDR